jgi:1-deoxy-D-xylulose-5-phosphate synthase
MGGAGSAVLELLQAEGLATPVVQLGLPDAWLEHASREDLLAVAGLDVAGIRSANLARWSHLGSAVRVAS